MVNKWVNKQRLKIFETLLYFILSQIQLISIFQIVQTHLKPIIIQLTIWANRKLHALAQESLINRLEIFVFMSRIDYGASVT